MNGFAGKRSESCSGSNQGSIGAGTNVAFRQKRESSFDNCMLLLLLELC